MSVASTRVPVDGRPLRVFEGGSGPGVPLVLLHGIGSTGQSFERQLATLAPGRRVLAWTMPGYADSAPLPMAHPTPDDYARIVHAWLDAAAIDRCVLLGHSLGALIGTRLAVAAPERIHHLILSSPAQGYRHASDTPLPAALQGRIDDVRTLGPAGMAEARASRTLAETATPEMLAAARAAMSSVTAGGYEQAVWCLAQGDLPADLRRRGPARTTIVCGTVDRVTPFAGVAELAAAVGCHDLRPIEGGGHASYIDAADRYDATLVDILADVTNA